MESNLWILGTLGIVAMETSYVPQIARLHRLKRADDLSVLFPALNIFGRALAMLFALLSSQPVFSIGLSIGIVLRSTFLAQVVWYRYGGAFLERAQLRPAEVGVSTGGRQRS